MNLRRWLTIVATVEVISLAVLLINRSTFQIAPLTSSMGPVHGLAYLSTIALAALSPIPRAAKAFAWVPVVGGLIALRLTRSRSAVVTPRDAASEGHSPARREIDDISDPAIEASEFVKSFRSGSSVGPVSLSVPRGKITGLVGPNGAGKTTTLRSMVGLVRPTGGRILIDGAPVSESGSLARVGALIEAPALVPGLSGRRNVESIALLAGWDPRQAADVLRQVGLESDADKKVAEYSLGMRQRLALAIALLNDPDIVVLDEPANGLDPQGIADLRGFLRDLADRGATVLVSSHLLGEIEQICDHLIVMAGGRVLYEGPTSGALTGREVIHLEPLVAADVPALAGVVGVAAAAAPVVGAGFVTIAGDRELAARLIVAAVRAGIWIVQARIATPTLEEAFLDLTGEQTPTAAVPTGEVR